MREFRRQQNRARRKHEREALEEREKNVKIFIFIVYMKWRKKSWKESFQLRVPFTRLLSLFRNLHTKRVDEQLRIIRCASFFIPPTNLSTLRQSLKEMKKLRKEMAKHFLFFAYSAHCLCLVLFFKHSKEKFFEQMFFPSRFYDSQSKKLFGVVDAFTMWWELFTLVEWEIYIHWHNNDEWGRLLCNKLIFRTEKKVEIHCN